MKPSRPVTRAKCATCQAKFKRTRSDARYCSAACRQRAHRARAQLDDLDREIEAARLHYWQLVRQKAEASGTTPSQVVTAQAQFVDEEGYVYVNGWGRRDPKARLVGRVPPSRPGWGATWGAEAAGPPWSVPPFTAPKGTA